MDKNTILGFLLIAGIMFGYYKWTAPSAAEIEHMKQVQIAQQDSIARVQQAAIDKQRLADFQKEGSLDSTVTLDSVKALTKKSEFGSFYNATQGTEEIYTLENNKVKIQISSKGAQVISVELKEYKKYNGDPLILFSKGDSKFSFTLNANNRLVPSSSLYFTSTSAKILDATTQQQTLVLSVHGASGEPLEFIYTLAPESPRLDFTMTGAGLLSSLATNSTSVSLDWSQKMPQIEKGRSFEQRYARTYFKYKGEKEDVDRLSDSKTEDKSIGVTMEWISYKDQFFSTFLRSKQDFQSGTLKTEKIDTGDYLKTLGAELMIPISSVKPTVDLEFYYLPNKLEILKSMDVHANKKLEFEGVVPMGWGIFGWINKIVIVKIFNFLENYLSNYGIIILLLTIIIKIGIFPFTFKSYLSTAKMRLLKPEIDEINERIPDTKPTERQKATMALYSKAGVSPMGGCIPMLFQMPILFAMYSFFPVAFELRQQPFLWAKDLSSYDAFITWSHSIPFLGNHLSLFCLLMTVTNVIYTYINSAATASQTSSMPMMKYMMYGMPVMFFFVLNDYASGLSYYYFVSTLITIIQTIAMRYMVDEDKLLAQLEQNKKKTKKKSGWQARLEQVQKDQKQAAKKRR